MIITITAFAVRQIEKIPNQFQVYIDLSTKRKMMKKLIFSLCILLLTACSAKEIVSPEGYDPTQHARIRIFDGAGYYVDIDCKENKGGTHIFTSELSWFSNKTDSQGRIIIGMPNSPNTVNAEKNDLTYREYVVHANLPINIYPSVRVVDRTVCPGGNKPCYQVTKDLCHRGESDLEAMLINTIFRTDLATKENDSRRSFIPQAGQQYDIVPNGCSVTLYNISQDEPKKEPLSPVYQCK
ncbi:hypothetical protein [Lonepinella sp. BR2357]|uniref:hypothetical protein n=1 Tax=Lonepinella sp. BR2357 TaxID=3434549 RepID=UPI003F6DABA7